MLINLRNALMSGKRLPYDAEVEFLESTGTQWVDTGVIAGDDTTFSVRFNCTSTNDTAIYGGRSQSQGRQWILPLQMNQIQFGYGSIYQNINVQYHGNWLNIDTSLSAESYTYKVTTDGGVETLVSTPRQSFTNTAHILLFAAWNNTAVGYKTVAKVAKFQIWKNGVLVRDFIPVRKGTVGYLYDRVSGKLFGNAGTGDFVLGPDVVPVEWVRMGDGQYTLFDYTPSADTSCEVKIRPIILNPKNGSRGIFGSEIANNNKSFIVMFENDQWATNLLQFRFGTYLNQTDVTQFEAGNLYSIKLNSSGGFVDGIKVVNTKTATPSGSTQTKFGIGCYIRGGNVFSTLGTYDYYGLTIEDGIFSANFRPVRVGTDATSWEGAMMDVLTRRIYRNAGTGAFTYGNDLPYPIPAA